MWHVWGTNKVQDKGSTHKNGKNVEVKCDQGHTAAERFSKWGGGKFLKSKMVIKIGALAPAVALARRRGGVLGMWPLRSWSFFENVVLNEAIWCTIFHHIKHLTACLLGCQDSQKVEGPLAPLPPPRFRCL